MESMKRDRLIKKLIKTKIKNYSVKNKIKKKFVKRDRTKTNRNVNWTR